MGATSLGADLGICNIICRWMPEGKFAMLVYDPDIGRIVIRPLKNIYDANEQAKISWQWHAYSINGKIAFHNDKYTTFNWWDYYHNGGGYCSWLGAYDAESMNDGDPGPSVASSVYLRPNLEYFSFENQ